MAWGRISQYCEKVRSVLWKIMREWGGGIKRAPVQVVSVNKLRLEDAAFISNKKRDKQIT